jgi:class 3 adenylate cyclase/tetratricopeptide (TPR) repeat protein
LRGQTVDAVAERRAVYVPELALGWDLSTGPRWRELEGTLIFADLSGFTRLSERLARVGRDGAEVVKDIINSVFEPCVAAVLANRGDVVKFAGDGLMCLFDGGDHQCRAARAAVAMQRAVRVAGRVATPAGPARLSISIGAESGTVLCLLARAHRDELVLTGPTVDRMFAIEAAARPGQVLVGELLAASLPATWTRSDRASGHRQLRADRIDATTACVARLEWSGADPGRLLAPQVCAVLEQGEVPAEHRSVAVAFVALGGVGALLEAGGPGHLLEHVDRFASIVDDACASADVCWLESDADRDQIRMLLTAGAPHRTDIDEQRIVDAVWTAVREGGALGLSVRAGVSRGRVFVGDVGHPLRRTYNVMGDAVNVAARLAARAAPGEILAIDEVVAARRSMVSAEAVAPMTVKGRRQALAVSRIVGLRLRSEESTHGRPMIGRQHELDALLDALDACSSGHGRAFEVVGSPGLGKSHFVGELAARAVPATTVTMAGALYDRSTPYGASALMFRQLAGIDPAADPATAGHVLETVVAARSPELTDVVPLIADAARAAVADTESTKAISEEFRADRIHDAVIAFMRALRNGPLLLIAEDTHWFDDASRALLQAVVRAADTAPWLIVATRRPDGVGIEGATAIELAPLEADDVRQLVIGSIGDDAMAVHDLERVVRQASGNPLFARELAASVEGGAGLPDSVERVVASRIDNLPAPQRNLLRDLSVAGAHAELELVGDALGERALTGVGAWEAVAEFVSVDGKSVAFRHDLYRVAAYDGLSYRRRRELHTRFATLLAARPDATHTSALIAYHAHEAGEHAMTWRWACVAAGSAAAAGAVVEAAEHYARAIAAADRLGDVVPTEVASVAEALGDTQELLGHTDAAHEGYRRARRLLDDSVALGRLHRKHARVAERAGDYRSSLNWCTKGLHLLDADESPRALSSRAELQLAASVTRFFQGRFEAAIELARAGAADAERSDNLAALAQAHLQLEMACSELDLPERVEHGQRALELFESLGDSLGLANLHLNLGVSSYNDGRWDDALDHYEASIDAYHRVGDAVGAEAARNNQAEILTDQGHYEAAAVRLAEARRALKAANYRIGIAITASGQARVALRSEDFDTAAALLDEARREFIALNATNMVVDTDIRRVELLVWSGRQREALELATDATAGLDRLGAVAILPATLARLRGWALALAGELTPATVELNRALDLARKGGVPYEAALALDALDIVRVAAGGVSDLAATAERDRLLDALGVVAIPRPPDATNSAALRLETETQRRREPVG